MEAISQSKNLKLYFTNRDEQKRSRRSRMKSLIQSQANLKEKEPIDSNLNIKSSEDSAKQSSSQEEIKTIDTPYDESESLSKNSRKLRSKNKDRKVNDNGISKSM